jgi:hypothetical protein
MADANEEDGQVPKLPFKEQVKAFAKIHRGTVSHGNDYRECRRRLMRCVPFHTAPWKGAMILCHSSFTITYTMLPLHATGRREGVRKEDFKWRGGSAVRLSYDFVVVLGL